MLYTVDLIFDLHHLCIIDFKTLHYFSIAFVIAKKFAIM